MRIVVLLAALVLAAPAGGSEPPVQLFVQAFDTRPGAVAETDVDLVLSGGGGAVTIDVPAGYRLDVAARPGTVVGSATLRAPRPASARLVAAAASGHAAIWTAGSLMVLVDRVADEYRLAFTPPAGAEEIDLDLLGVLTNPAAPELVTWRAVVGGIEARSVVGIPQTLGFRAGYEGGLRLHGRLRSAGKPRRGVIVHFAVATSPDLSDARDVGAARTQVDGTYSLTHSFPRVRAAQHLTLIAYVNFYAGSCDRCVPQSTAPPPADVVSLTIPPR